VADAVEYQPDGVFDLVVASGILSIWEDFRVPLSRWCEWLSPLGVLHIFGRFNSDNVDTITRFREGGSLGVWESGFTSYSIGTVGEFLKQQGYSCSFEPFVLQRDIERSASPIATFTVQLKDGGRLVLNGANIRAEHFFLTVTRRHAVKR
jgi:hypothetical protein